MIRVTKWRPGLRRSGIALCNAMFAVLCVPSPAASAISGSMDDWLNAVCQPDRIYETTTRFAVGGSTCVPRSGTGYVVFDLFAAKADREFIMTASKSAYTARFEAEGYYGAIWSLTGGGSDLAPLTQFGFDIRGPIRTPIPEVKVVIVPEKPGTDTGATGGTRPPSDGQFLAAANQYLRIPRPPDKFILQLGRQVCQIQRDGGSVDDAEVSIWKTWNASGLGPATSAETGSLVQSAGDTLCPAAR